MAFRVIGTLLLLQLLTHIGCDGVVGSPRVRDACGVCGGDNSTCHLVSGIFTEPHLREGYQLVLQIPAGACSIRIEEVVPTRNYLALRAGNKEFIVNGAWNIDNSGQYQGAGATFMYRRQTDTQGETLAATGPITEPVDIFLLYRQMNRGIKYEYVIKRNASLSSVLPRLPNDLQSLPPAPPPALPALPQLPARPSVVPRPTGHRNAVPAPGVARPPHTAPRLPATPAGAGSSGPAPSPFHAATPPHQPGRRRGPGTATGHRRGHRTGRRRGRVHRPGLPQQTAPARPAPRPGSEPARARPAAGPGTHRRRRRRRRRSRFQWVVPGYSECSKSCGGGTRVPEVVCVRRKKKQLAPDSKCNPRRRPRTRPVLCNTAPCPVRSVGTGDRWWSRTAVWRANEWSACSSSCGAGHQTRTFLCVRAGQPVEVTECVGRPTEPETQPCNSGPCRPELRWHVGRWSACSVSCGWGTRTRSVTCTDQLAGCPESERPRDTAPCRRADCPPTEEPGGPGQGGPPPPAGWMVTDWTQQCSVECGQGVQSRGVACGGDPGRCDLSQRPSDTRPCKTDRGCAGTWFTGPWSQCSRECGVGGEATRTVLCVRQSAGQFSVTADLSCAGSPRPAAQQPCGAGPERRCPPRWFTAEWAECSVTCGSGQQRRVVACVGADGRLAAGCPDGERPEERRPCQQAECPGAAFTTEPAPTPPSRPESPAAEPPSQPRLTPVLGPEYHTVEGSDTEVQLGSEDGPLGGHGTGLSGGDRSDSCTDSLSHCSLVRRARLCQTSFYATSCCASCRHQRR
ncbi:Thrombospondin type-1 domain-containing protein 4 [Amphibalanus amphitrite]|uniref:Thrombospondin type-1 domain-containing protein 4 n=1 Tax=Amphibalanus amphitrite TaxID=1232801 RepID=A0A6A4WR87_AMPAM|nr:Thrombospondin type-1 domain-containing protein 4 [Amphibalanus amphitrite]